jgi:hypothetical protein
MLRVTDFTAVVLYIYHLALLSYLTEMEFCLAHLNEILDFQVGD